MGIISKKITNNDFNERSPRINNLGQVIYECEGIALHTLCGFTFDIPIPREIIGVDLDFNVWFQGFDIDINDNGLIVYPCGARDVDILCTVNFDGSNLKEIPLGEFGAGASPVINNNGMIAYSCMSMSSSGSISQLITSICSVNADGSNARILAENFDFMRRPAINDAGMIVYQCVPGRWPQRDLHH